jgi:vancomycin resistance protein VanJ
MPESRLACPGLARIAAVASPELDVPREDASGSSRRGRLVVISAVLLAAVVSAHRWVPNVRGMGSLLDSAVPLSAALVPALGIAALVRRSRRAAVAALLPAVAWAALFGSAWLPPRTSGDAQLRVVSQNLRAGNPDAAATVRALMATDPHLIALQEVDERSRETLGHSLHPRYPHRATVSTVSLWSRFPIRTYGGVDTGLEWTRAVRAIVAAPGGDVAVYVAHLGSARIGETATRDRTVAGLARHVRADEADRVILLGDLNTAATDRVIRPLTDLLRNAQADAGRGFGFTWPARLPVTRPDHVLYRGLTATSAGVLRTPASDHRAVTAGFRTQALSGKPARAGGDRVRRGR